MKNTVYIILTLLKAIMIIGGMVYLISNVISWTKTKDGKKLKNAVIIFGGIFISLIILTVIEFIIALN